MRVPAHVLTECKSLVAAGSHHGAIARLLAEAASSGASGVDCSATVQGSIAKLKADHYLALCVEMAADPREVGGAATELPWRIWPCRRRLLPLSTTSTPPPPPPLRAVLLLPPARSRRATASWS
jgi:hypothetical protein